MKFFYSPKNYDHNLADPELHKKVETLKSHYSLEQRDVDTSQGVGNIYTPITHHENDYVPEELHGKHLIEDAPNTEKIHPPNKTGTLSNNSFFIKKEHFCEEDPNKKIEFSDRTSILKRIDTDNFLEHCKYHHETSTKELTNIVDGSTVHINDNIDNLKPTNVTKNTDHITVEYEEND